MIHGRTAARAGAVIALFASTAFAKKYEVVPGEYVVKMKPQMSTMSVVQIEQSLGAKVVEKLSPESNAILVKRPAGEVESFSIAALKRSPLVEYAEPNFIYRIVAGSTSLPNDPELSNLWGLINSGQKSTGDMGDIAGKAGVDIDAKRAWEIETGSSSVVVASIDTGVDHTIADLAPNMWINEREKSGSPGVDDDGNGFVDDVYGYDFVNNDGDPKDDHGHGSHTSGTIAAKGNNGQGVVGVAWNARVMGVKFLSADGGGTLADAVKSIDYTTKMKVDMTSNSWGGGGFSQALYDAIKRAQDAGILFVAAAGNSSEDNDSSPNYPATYDLDNIVSVAAIDNAGELAYFSCYGKQTVDVAAPGVNVLSTTPSGLASWSGTSMATPHVTGVAVLLKSADPSLGYAQIKERLMRTARPLASLRGKVASAGLVNAYYALTNTTPPGDANDPFNWDKKSENIATAHPYADKYSNTWTVTVPGAQRIALYFSRFETELGYDKVTMKDGNGQVVAVWSGNRNDSFSPVIEGDKVEITFTSDDSVNGFGFEISGVAYQ